MALRTGEEYKESLKDGRQVYISGEKVADITTHPILGVAVNTAAAGYDLALNPPAGEEDVFATAHPETGELTNRFFVIPRSAKDLEYRTRIIRSCIETIGYLPFGKEIGTDCLNAAYFVAAKMGNAQYQKNVLNFFEHIRKSDLHTCGAVTDVKGDRSKSPSSQKHPDYYLRVVEKNDKGIIVKGAKIHITNAAMANEIVVLPTRQMGEGEEDYAVSFAIPANTEGIRLICRADRGDWKENEFHGHFPVGRVNDAMVVFDNVFVPWERVFMCGEWKYSMFITYTFATFHRFSAISYKVPLVELTAGCAVAMAEYNGLNKKEHIRNKIAEIAAYVETLRALADASAKSPVMYSDLAVPNPLITNMAKYHFADNYHQFIRNVQDIAGGIIATTPDKKDWENPETHDDLEYYLGGRPDVSTEARMRMIHQTMRQVCSHDSAWEEVVTLHAEGSMAAQLMMIYQESPLQKYKKMAETAAGIRVPDSTD